MVLTSVAKSRILIKPAYEIARRVYRGELSVSEGSRLLNIQHGINRNSARDLITAYRQLLRGDLFQRGLSGPDMDYYLHSISRDEGPTTLRMALQSLWRHIGYYEGIRKVRLHTLRAVAAKHEANAAAPLPIEVLSENLEQEVALSLKESATARRTRLRSAPRIPSRMPVVVMAFARNPDVVAEVLHRANGFCEACKKKAPFIRRSDGSAYLEVHHLHQLADGGEDTVENAQALCPNCHRRLHYGK